MYKHFLLFILFSTFMLRLVAQTERVASMAWVKKVGAGKFPASKKIYWVHHYGEVSDSNKVISAIIKMTIDDCAKKGGGIVAVNPGVYLTGSIFIKSNVHLKIDKGVLIKGSTDFADYPEIDTRIAGIEMKWPAALMNGKNTEHAK